MRVEATKRIRRNIGELNARMRAADKNKEQPIGSGQDTITLSQARSRLDQRRFSRPNTHFFSIFQPLQEIIFSQANLQNFDKNFQNFAKYLRNLQNLANFCKICRIFYRILQIFVDFEKCRKMLYWCSFYTWTPEFWILQFVQILLQKEKGRFC